MGSIEKMREKRKKAKMTVSGLGAGGVGGAYIGGPGGALAGGIIGGIAGYLLDKILNSMKEDKEDQK